jgi:two-component system phosphoglycerate transport system sensor histidine kinase PgtB
VVGQTMTTLAHEINQPLNALSMYLFTAGTGD